MPRLPARAREELCVIRVGDRELCVYPLDETLALLGRKWAIVIIGALGNRSRLRFGELQAALPGIGERTLSDRLKELAAAGLVERRVYGEIPPRTEYHLTNEGEKVRAALIPLLEWSVLRSGTG